jgi:hypothetical protein
VRADVSSFERVEEGRAVRLGTVLLVVVALLFVIIALPVVLRGAPLADDFVNCLEPQRTGLGSTLAASFERLGALRRAHLLEIMITTEICQHLPFGFAIAVPLLLTLGIAVVLRGLLQDLGTPGAWPSLGGALWLLQPLGTEAALWPAAMHVPLGLILALAALRLHRSGRHVWGALAVAGAGLSVEQVLLVLPLAIWLTAPPEHRRRALGATIVVVASLLLAFIVWPGGDPRLGITLGERVAGALDDPAFPVKFAAVGLGLHSIPLAASWAFPASVLLFALGALVGSWFGPAVLSTPETPAWSDRAPAGRTLFAGVGLIALANVPVILNLPHQGSPRLFAPTWLVLSGMVAAIGPLLVQRGLRWWGTVAGIFAAGALLSLTLSVGVRLESASFTASASRRIAARVQDNALIAVCEVRRTVVEPAPRGAFAVHEFIYDWAAREALDYYTGKRASFKLAGEPWGARPCPDPEDVDRVFSFSDLFIGRDNDA